MELYVRDGCPFCKKVLAALEHLDLQEGADIRVIDAAPGTPGRDTVLQVGGKAMVPFLIDGADWMYESDDIVAYLERRAAS